MRVRFDGSGKEAELESLSWPSLVWVDPIDLEGLADLELADARRLVLQKLAEAGPSGPTRMGIAARLLRPMEAELRRRGMRLE
jgi:hypothetical protein